MEVTMEMEYHTDDGEWKDGPADLSALPAGTVVTVCYPAATILMRFIENMAQ